VCGANFSNRQGSVNFFLNKIFTRFVRGGSKPIKEEGNTGSERETVLKWGENVIVPSALKHGMCASRELRFKNRTVILALYPLYLSRFRRDEPIIFPLIGCCPAGTPGKWFQSEFISAGRCRGKGMNAPKYIAERRDPERAN